MKQILIILMSCFSAINAGEIAIQKFPSHYNISSKKFNADIPNYMVSKQLRSMDSTKLAAVLNSGSAYLDINECSDGQYSMDIKGRIRGGGPITGTVLYWFTKVGCYGAATAAAGTVIVTTGGTALGAVGVGAAGAGVSVAGAGLGMAAGAAIEGAAMGGAIAVAGSSVAGAGTLIGAAAVGLGAEGALVAGTGAAVVSAGGVAGAIAAVESASLGAFAFGLMLPLP
jgi:hypothetical protein